eukprot:UN11873
MGCCLSKWNSEDNNNDTKAIDEIPKTKEKPLPRPRLDIKAGLSANVARISQDFSPINEDNITPLDGDDDDTYGYPLPKANQNNSNIRIPICIDKKM